MKLGWEADTLLVWIIDGIAFHEDSDIFPGGRCSAVLQVDAVRLVIGKAIRLPAKRRNWSRVDQGQLETYKDAESVNAGPPYEARYGIFTVSGVVELAAINLNVKEFWATPVGPARSPNLCEKLVPEIR